MRVYRRLLHPESLCSSCKHSPYLFNFCHSRCLFCLRVFTLLNSLGARDFSIAHSKLASTRTTTATRQLLRSTPSQTTIPNSLRLAPPLRNVRHYLPQRTMAHLFTTDVRAHDPLSREHALRCGQPLARVLKLSWDDIKICIKGRERGYDAARFRAPNEPYLQRAGCPTLSTAIINAS